MSGFSRFSGPQAGSRPTLQPRPRAAFRLAGPVRIGDGASRLAIPAGVARRPARAEDGLSTAALALALSAVAVQMLIPSTLLFAIGIDYAAPGGNPIVKFHPGTYLAVLAAMVVLLGQRAPVRTAIAHFRAHPGHFLLLSTMTACMTYSIVVSGVSGVAVFVESYISAGVLAVVLSFANARQLRILAWLFLALVLLNVFVALGEAAAQTHLINPVLSTIAYKDPPGEFRSTAFYEHPLTGAMLTMFGLYVALEMRLKPVHAAPVLVTITLGLLAFGGRAALGTTLIFMVAGGVLYATRESLAQRLTLRAIAPALVVLFLMLMAAWIALAYTDLAERIVNKLYFDSSAEVRSSQWGVLRLMDVHDLLFGASPDEIRFLTYQLGILTDLENFWLISFVQLGALGFLLYLAGFFGFMHQLWRAAPVLGRMMLVSGILVASTSNSFARKSNVLFLLTAAIYAVAVPRGPNGTSTERPGAGPRPTGAPAAPGRTVVIRRPNTLPRRREPT